MLDRLDAFLFAAPAAFFAFWRSDRRAAVVLTACAAGTLYGMTRVALLGATGSIGRQALEVIEATPSLELVACDVRLDTDRRPRAADPGGRRPDRAARPGRAGRRPQREVGFAGLPARCGARARRYARAREQGEPRRRGRARACVRESAGGGALIPVDSEHSALFQCALGSASRKVIVLTASGGPFRGRTRDELAAVTGGRGPRAPHLEHGRRRSRSTRRRSRTRGSR